MKKYLLVLVLVTSVSAASAQLRVGLKAGANATTAKVIATDGSRPSVPYSGGYHVGAELKVLLEGQLYFVPQVQYSHKVFAIEYNNVDTSVNTLKMNYLEIPLLFEWKKSFYKSGIFVQFGPSMSFVLSGKEEITGKEEMNKPMKIASTAYGRAEANAVINVGYQFGRSFQFTIGYVYGMGTIVDNDNGPVIKPRMFTASVHYFLN
ncbi:porin family protein [Pollutibacter soli]|uniref:porin family protein n=1 Tax=Pollutibacter soli TaxID=3034157 RepID=UPI003013DE3C